MPNDFHEAPWPPLRNAIVSVLRQHRPHTVYGFGEVDVTDSLAALRRHQRAVGIAVSFHAFILYCIARAADEHPAVHTFRFHRKLITFKDIDIGTLIEKRVRGQGRLPVQHIVRAANRKSLAAINWEIRTASRSDPTKDPNVRLRRRVAGLPGIVRRIVSWRIGRSPFLLKKFHGTMGLTNLQHPGIQRPFFGLPPNIFTLTMAVGSITDRFLPDDLGRPRLRRMLCLSGGADHAVIDGMSLSRFSERLIQLIESAAGLDDSFIAESRRLRRESGE
jgi:pyruvate/2-oxoglutarate dehydrogenase complex dihydrolipoamide acyltransferase (E2) component